MNILFDLGHPAHVHLFKNFIRYLSENDHKVTVTARDKDVTTVLLDHYKIPYLTLSKPQKGVFGMATELISRDIQIMKLHRKHNFDVAFGTSVSIAHLSAISKVKSYCFADDDDDVIPLYTYLTYPFATKIINPIGLKFNKWKNKRVLYGSYQKLAYLHPDNFTPDPAIPRRYGMEPGKYILIRNSALKAHHDRAAKGIGTDLQSEIDRIVSEYPTVLSKENQKAKIEPWDMHHILAFAKLLITDSQSMTVEAAVLGVPNIRYNTFAGRISCLEELEKKYNLTFGYRPGEEKNLIETLEKLLVTENLAEAWQEKRHRMLKEKEDFNQWLINYFETEINKGYNA